jgi:hypothetical protein
MILKIILASAFLVVGIIFLCLGFRSEFKDDFEYID